MRRAAASPSSTAGASTINMPRVVPNTTGNRVWYFAASATVASCVLSPNSSRKKDTTAVP